MADLVFTIHADPPLTFYRGTRPASADLAWPRLDRVTGIRQKWRFGRGENGNASVTLSNSDGALTGEFSDPPLLAEASIAENGAEIFRGVISQIATGADVSIDIESGGTRRYTDKVPLRTTADLGGYTELKPLPVVYGSVTIQPLRYDGSGHLWLLADHPISGVDRVELQGREISDWILQQAADDSGSPVAVLETKEQIAEPSDLRATVRGKMHPDTGETMTRPDLVLWDFLANVCEMPVTAADLDQLRSDASDLAIGGVIDDNSATIQTVVDQITSNAGLAWSPAHPGIAKKWPATPVAPNDPRQSLTVKNAPTLYARASLSSLATVVEVAYGYEPASGDHRRTVRLVASERVGRHGRIEAKIKAGWLHDHAAAIAYGTRWLEYYSRPIWTVTASRYRGDFSPGETVSIDHPFSPPTVATITAMDRTETADRLTLEAPDGAIPTIAIESLSSGVAVDAMAAPLYEIQDDTAQILITSPEGVPLPGARVTINDSVIKTADAAGWIIIPADPGEHSLLIQSPGFDDQLVRVWLS